MRQPHPFLPLSLLLAPSVTYSEECSTALYSANAELQLFLTVELRFYTHTHTHTQKDSHSTWLLKYDTRQVSGDNFFIFFFKKRNTKKGDILTTPYLIHQFLSTEPGLHCDWELAAYTLPTASLITFPCN